MRVLLHVDHDEIADADADVVALTDGFAAEPITVVAVGAYFCDVDECQMEARFLFTRSMPAPGVQYWIVAYACEQHEHELEASLRTTSLQLGGPEAQSDVIKRRVL